MSFSKSLENLEKTNIFFLDLLLGLKMDIFAPCQSLVNLPSIIGDTFEHSVNMVIEFNSFQVSSLWNNHVQEHRVHYTTKNSRILELIYALSYN